MQSEMATEADIERHFRSVQSRFERVQYSLPQLRIAFEGLTVKDYTHKSADSIVHRLQHLALKCCIPALYRAKQEQHKRTVLSGCTGQIRPGKMTLLLGPPDSGKTLLMQTLAGKLHSRKTTLKVEGRLQYCDTLIDKLDPRKFAIYVGDNVQQLGELTVRETLQMALNCQGMPYSRGILREVRQKEQRLCVEVDEDLDLEMEGLLTGAVNDAQYVDYVINHLGLATCADQLVGNTLVGGISGGEMKRLALGEALISPKPIIFLDDALDGLDSAIARQVVKFIGEVAASQKKTIVLSAQQLSESIMLLFDDLMLIARGELLYHGTLDSLRDSFEFNLQEMKITLHHAVHDFLHHKMTGVQPKRKSASYRKTAEMIYRGQEVSLSLKSGHDLDESPLPCLAVQSPWVQTYVCYDLKKIQAKRSLPLLLLWFSKALVVGGILAVTVSQMDIHGGHQDSADVYLRLIFFTLAMTLVDGALEISLVLMELPVVIRHRELNYYPVWAYLTAASIMKLPASVIFAVLWSLLVYFPTGLPLLVANYFWFLLFTFALHAMGISFFRLAACLGGDLTTALMLSSFYSMIILLIKGDNQDTGDMTGYWRWLLWIFNPLIFIKKAFAINVFGAELWQVPLNGSTLGNQLLLSLDCPISNFVYWCALGVVTQVIFWLAFNIASWAYLAFSPEKGPKRNTSIEATVKAQASSRTDLPHDDTDRAASVALKQRVARAHLKDIDQSSDEADTSVLSGKNPPGWKRLTAQELNEEIDREIKAYDEQQEGIERDDQQHQKGALLGLQEPGMISSPQDLNRQNYTFQDLEDLETEYSNSTNSSVDAYSFEFPAMTLTFSHINCRMKASMDKTVVERQFLQDCSGMICPGVLTALLGHSGAGKSTLLNVLASRKNTGEVRGEVFLDGKKQSLVKASPYLGYVIQTTELLPFLTVKETLWRSARLRLDACHSNKAIRSWIAKVEEMLHLTAVDTIVGDPGSGGLNLVQRKRIGIAIEILANPSVLLLDEPTTGMYEPDALVIIRLLKDLAREGRAVFCSIHQPSRRLFQVFDEVMVVGFGGRILFQGALGKNSSNAVQHFQAAIPSPQDVEVGNTNPAAWILQVCVPETEWKLGADFAQHYALSRQALAIREGIRISRMVEPPPKPRTPYAISQLRCLWLLLQQDFAMYCRDTAYNGWRLFFGTAMGLIIGVALRTSGHISGKLSVFKNVIRDFYIIIFYLASINNMMVQVPVQTKRLVAFRERNSRAYGSIPLVLSTCLIEAPFNFLQAVLLSITSYWLLGFENNAAKFFMHLLVVFMSTYAITLWGILVTFLTPDMSYASVTTNIISGIWTLFTGFILPIKWVPGFFSWIPYTVPLYWFLGGVVINQYGDKEELLQPQYRTGKLSLASLTNEQFNLNHSFLPWILLVLIGLWIFYMAAAIAAFRFCRYHKV